MKQFGLMILLCCIGMTAAGFEVVPPDDAIGFNDMEFLLIYDEQQTVDGARLYFQPRGMDRTVFIEFQQSEGRWTATVPARFVPDAKLEYFAEIRDAQGTMHRVPADGRYSLDIHPYDIPPQFELTYPKGLSISADEQQLMVIRVSRHVGIEKLEASFEGRDVAFIDQRDGWITLQVRPRNEGQQVLKLKVADAAGNITEEQFLFSVFKPEVTPWVSSSFDWFIEAEASYTGKGIWDPSEDPSYAYEHEYPLSLSLGNSVYAGIGPLSISAGLSFIHEDTPLGMIDSVPNVLSADLFDIFHLWHPWNFEKEFDFPETRVRNYDGGSLYYLTLSLFKDALLYQFGDQSVTFQKFTVSNVNFRGTSLEMNLPFFSFKVAKGLTDMGLKEAAWPQQFFGVQTGLGWKEYFTLQTNLSLFTDFQGRYDEIRGGTSHVKTHFNLDGVPPKQNFVLGLGISSDSRLLNIEGDVGFSIYTDDISNVIDIKELAETIVDFIQDGDDNGSLEGSDLEKYFVYLDQVQRIFPILDYFPLNIGLAESLLDGRGMVYNLEMDIKPLDLKLFFYKADGNYRSLGAPAASDVMKTGASWSGSMRSIRTNLSYTYERNIIPDILVYDILRHFLSGEILDILLAFGKPAQEQAIFIQEGKLKLNTPRFGYFGSFGLGYKVKYEYTQDVDTFIAFSSDDDMAVTHTAELAWGSGGHRFGLIRGSLDIKGAGVFNQQLLNDGMNTSPDDWYWDYKFSVNPRIQFGVLRSRLSYEQSWSQLPESDSYRTYKGSVQFTLFGEIIEDVTVAGEVNETYDSSSVLSEREYELSMGIRQTLFSLLDIEASAKISFLDDRVQETFDMLKGEHSFTVSGGISF